MSSGLQISKNQGGDRRNLHAASAENHLEVAEHRWGSRSWSGPGEYDTWQSGTVWTGGADPDWIIAPERPCALPGPAGSASAPSSRCRRGPEQWRRFLRDTTTNRARPRERQRFPTCRALPHSRAPGRQTDHRPLSGTVGSARQPSTGFEHRVAQLVLCRLSWELLKKTWSVLARRRARHARSRR